MKWEPAEYQERAVEHLLTESFSGLFLKPGMRKTSITLAAFKVLQEVGMVKSMLVLAPLRVCYTSWPNEVKKWEDFNEFSVGIMHGKNKDEVLNEKHDIYLINYEGIDWLTDRLSEMKKWPFDMLVVDEVSKVKNIHSQRHTLLKPILRFFKRRVILTGSPMANGLNDLFGQVYVMDRGASFGPYITKWRKEHFYPFGYGVKDWLPKLGTEKKFQEILSPRVFYAHDEDYLNLPEVIEKDIIIDLPKKARAAYDQMENTLQLEFQKGRINAANVGVALNKCRQIANGGVFIDAKKNIWQHIHDEKTEAVKDLIEELAGQPALITYDFRHDLERLQKALGPDTPFIGDGGVKPKNMPALIEAWNRGEVPYVFVNAQSMAHGVDGFQEAGRAVVWHSLDYNYENYDQLIRRLKRSGQRERVLVAHIIAGKTVDLAVLTALRKKEKNQNTLFMALREYWENA